MFIYYALNALYIYIYTSVIEFTEIIITDIMNLYTFTDKIKYKTQT